jgi:beta-galactosidase/beta-glucuronidase
MGLEIERERHGFDYDDPDTVRKQFEYVKGEVLKYKDHPALLAWGIGNELNLRSTKPGVWDAVNDIAAMIHELDPNHPTTTMLAGFNKSLGEELKQYCPKLDFLSFQFYADIINLPNYLKEADIDHHTWLLSGGLPVIGSLQALPGEGRLNKTVKIRLNHTNLDLKM